MSFAEKGAVGDIEPAFFIGYLHRLKATGTLKFEDGSIQRAVYLRDGRVLFSSSNAPEDQLGAILVAAGKISAEAFEGIVASLEPKQSIAAALSQGGHVSQRDIGDSARRKVEQIVGACCAQTSGSYEFEDGVLPKGALDLKLTTERVLISAFEVLEPSGFLNRILKSPMAVLGASEFEPADPDLVRIKGALDGASSLADIGGTVGLPLASTEARAAVLVVLGAASVVTSQIEQMDLPDTGETTPGLPDFHLMPDVHLMEQPEPIGAGVLETPEDFSGSTIAFTPSPVGDSDSTLGTGLSESGLNPYAGSSEATFVMGPGAGPKTPRSASESGAIRMSGMKREKASTQDLDAVKELLGTPAPPRPPSSSIPAQRWEPVLSTGSRPGQGRGGMGALFRNSIVRRSIAAFLLGAVALVAYVVLTGQARQASPVSVSGTNPPMPSAPVGTPGPQNPAVLSSPPLTQATIPTTTLATGLPATTAPTGTPIPPTTPVAVTATAINPPLAAVPSPTALTVTPNKPSPNPIPKSTPVAPPSTAAAAKIAPSSKSSGSGYEALKAGLLAEASSSFEPVAQGHASEFSVQILVACSAQTIEKALQNDSSPDLFTLPATISGKPCHRLMRGFFATSAEASQAIATLPAYYVAEGAKPKAVLVRSVLP